MDICGNSKGAATDKGAVVRAPVGSSVARTKLESRVLDLVCCDTYSTSRGGNIYGIGFGGRTYSVCDFYRKVVVASRRSVARNSCSFASA